MKRLLLLLAFAVPLSAAWPNGYTFRRSITIDKTKVPNTNQTDFPVLLCFNGPASAPCDAANSNTLLPQLKVAGSGGEIQHTVTATFPYSHTIPADMVIADTDTTTMLPFEVESYVSTTGEIYIWVKIGTLTTATDYVVYIYYGNAAVVTDQSNPTGVWNAAYKMVEHLPDGTTLNLNDSTSTASTGTNTGSAVVFAGPVDGAIKTTTTTYADTGYTPASITDYTLEAWISEDVQVAVKFPLSARTSNGANGIFFLYEVNGNEGPEIGFTNAGNLSRKKWLSLLSNSPVFHHIVATHASGATTMTEYVDGVPGGTTTESAASDPGNGSSFVMGRDGANASSNGFNGKLDEIRFSTTVRSADWIATEFNNISSPNTFYTLGTQTTFTGGVRHRVIGGN